jgi:hypothetical protein
MLFLSPPSCRVYFGSGFASSLLQGPSRPQSWLSFCVVCHVLRLDPSPSPPPTSFDRKAVNGISSVKPLTTPLSSVSRRGALLPGWLPPCSWPPYGWRVFGGKAPRALIRGSGAGTSGAAAKIAIVCDRETIASTIAPTIAPIVARSATIPAIVGAIVVAIVSRLQAIATFAAAPLVPAPLPRLRRTPRNLN